MNAAPNRAMNATARQGLAALSGPLALRSRHSASTRNQCFKRHPPLSARQHEQPVAAQQMHRQVVVERKRHFTWPLQQPPSNLICWAVERVGGIDSVEYFVAGVLKRADRRLFREVVQVRIGVASVEQFLC